MRVMNNENLKRVFVPYRAAGRRILLAAAFTVILSCMTACSSKEAVLLESDELVMEDSRAAQGESSAQESSPPIQENEPYTDTAENRLQETDSAGQKVEQSTLFVHICGEVVSPGVYELPAGSRIYEAVEEADGFTPLAETSYVNLAQILEDGCKIKIPAIGEEPAGDGELSAGISAEPSAGEDSGLVDINAADKQLLCTLPGVGESRAESIISYREKTGGFKRIEDIMKVEGIKEGMFSKMKDKICVRGVR